MHKSIRKAQNEVSRWIITGIFAIVIGCSSHDGPVYTGNPAQSGIGSLCYTGYDCATGFCCTSPPCHGGMCTVQCRNDLDCPYGTRCDGGACFYNCFYDTDCALGQTCKKGRTLCQY